jgi:hypothetical protein
MLLMELKDTEAWHVAAAAAASSAAALAAAHDSASAAKALVAAHAASSAWVAATSTTSPTSLMAKEGGSRRADSASTGDGEESQPTSAAGAAPGSLAPASSRARRAAGLKALAAEGELGATARTAVFGSTIHNGTLTRMNVFAAIAAEREGLDWSFDNMPACMMAYEAADREGNGLSLLQTQRFCMYLLFYNEAWDLFQGTVLFSLRP